MTTKIAVMDNLNKVIEYNEKYGTATDEQKMYNVLTLTTGGEIYKNLFTCIFIWFIKCLLRDQV